MNVLRRRMDRAISRVVGRRLGWLIAVALLLVACNRNTPAIPTPLPPTATTGVIIAATATAPATVTIEASAPIPTAVAPAAVTTVGPTIEITSEGTIFSSPRTSYTVMLPNAWLVLPTSGTAIESALAEAEGDLPMWGDLNQRVQERANSVVLELIALLPDDEDATMPVAQMTITLLPTNALTLQAYMSATETELRAISNTDVVTTYIEPTLGMGGFPASIIEYTAASTPTNTNASEQTIAGLQVAFFNDDASTFVVMTFTTTTEHFAELKPAFLQIVRNVTRNDPAT